MRDVHRRLTRLEAQLNRAHAQLSHLSIILTGGPYDGVPSVEDPEAAIRRLEASCQCQTGACPVDPVVMLVQHPTPHEWRERYGDVEAIPCPTWPFGGEPGGSYA
jgi:hypothetical protein